jgi:UDP-2,3-diacylglucosamine pyrophosphatase LpxH
VVYIAGDVHLPGGDPAFSRFLDGLLARGPARLVILGDLFDYWLDTPHSRARYADCFARLARLREAGWRVDLLVGNREMTAGRMLDAGFGDRAVWPMLTFQLGPRRVRVVHGDRLCDDPGYHFLFAFMRSFWFRTMRACHPGWIQEGVARMIRWRSRTKQLQRRRQPRSRGASEDMLFSPRVRAVGRGVDTVVAGHIHESWRRRIAGVDLILAGDWSYDRGHWVEGYADGRLELRRSSFSTPLASAAEAVD